MARFKFSLQKVLDYRTQLEDEAKMAFARAMQDHRKQTELLDSVKSRLAAHEQSLYSGKEVTENDMWLWRRYRHRLQEEQMEAEVRMQETARELTRSRLKLVDRSKDRKLLERLREQQEVRFRKEENLKEQRESDEMATIRFQYGS